MKSGQVRDSCNQAGLKMTSAKVETLFVNTYKRAFKHSIPIRVKVKKKLTKNQDPVVTAVIVYTELRAGRIT